ncbi:MAG: ABC transporter ATP-binding protein [Hamadaea sp.]|uniref:ABC transporter ATP-binding protein n=1 Tax=Hamadaea sp. TaxID=2024425 RepID=UPI0017B1A93D|nr:ABC transporter ATP-binding protein [Hamadaea sp.]NUT21082.1 ABC transporter ATP-binding protein [Hamadaea sp.]
MISLRGIAVTYPGPPPVHALRSVDLDLDSGQHVAIVGPSGSGKSTLLNVLGLLDRPTAGVYQIDGTDVSRLPESDRTGIRGSRIGFVFQAFHLMPYRTAWENVAVAQLYRGVPARARRAAAAAALDLVGLSHRRDALPTTLSGGERQRVAIARALVNRPALMLCDEPTGNLDSANAAAVLDLLDGLRSEGLTIVVITHDAVVAARAQRTLAIHDGVLSEAVSHG